jgi:prepilin-type N-terminal cleavage/methylation domain-containing protein
MRSRGMTLIELLVAATVASLIMAGLLQGVISLFSSFTYAMGLNQTVVEAGDTANMVAAAIRKSAPCDPRSGCTVNPGSALAEGSATRVSVFLDSKGTRATFWNNAGQILYQAPNEGISVAVEEGSFSLKYYQASEYNAADLDEIQPTPSNLKNVIAVQVTVSVFRNGVKDTHSTLVRLRNSPFKM